MKKLLLLLFAAVAVVACQKNDDVEVQPLAETNDWIEVNGVHAPMKLEKTVNLPSSSRASSGNLCFTASHDFINYTNGYDDIQGEGDAREFIESNGEEFCDLGFSSYAFSLGTQELPAQYVTFADTDIYVAEYNILDGIFGFSVDGRNSQIIPNSIIVHKSFEYFILPFIYHVNRGNITGNIYEDAHFLSVIEDLKEYAARGISISKVEEDDTRSVYFPGGTDFVKVSLRTNSGYIWQGDFDSLDTILNQSAIDWIEFQYWTNGVSRTERFKL